MRRSIFERIHLEKTSGVICLEMMKKIQDAGFRIVEVPVHHYHRAYRQVPVLQLPADRQDRRSTSCVSGSRWSWSGSSVGPPRTRGRTPRTPSRPALRAVTTRTGSSTAAGEVMITGGLGFIGSNLARQLVDLGADVLLVDSLIPDYGGNLFNIDGIADRVRVNVADVRQQSTMNYLVRDRDVIFNLAGQVSHIDSMRDPYADLEINCRSQLTILEACRYNNPGVKVVFAGTRQVYGRPDSLPVDETHLVRPTDVNGINKAAGEYYHLVYNNVFSVRACSLRLTNVYGPRQLIRHNRQGFIGWFIRLAIEDGVIQIYGDGSQLRDFVYVDDAADAFLRAGANDACNGEVFNVGGDEPISHRDLSSLLVEIAGSGACGTSTGRPEKKAIDIGDFYADSSKFRRVDRLDADRGAARRTVRRPSRSTAQHFDRYVDRARRARSACDATPRIPFRPLAPREDAAGVRPRSIASSRAAGSSSGLKSRRSKPSSPPRQARRTRSASGTGTDALALILRALGIGPGDEVITTPLSAAYTALAIMMAGARPVFADIDPDRLTIDPARSRAPSTARTRAILPVHLYGQAADMAAIERIASRHASPIVEDCCQAHLANRGGASGRHHRRRRRVQLLSDEESRRARRRRRGRHQRSRARRAHQAAAKRRPEPIAYRHQDARRQFAARRDAGGDPARPAAVTRADGPRGAARWRRPTASAASQRAVTVPGRSSIPGTCTTCSSSGAARRAPRLQRHLQRAEGSRRWCTTRCRFPRQPALAAQPIRRLPRAARGVRRGPVAAAASCARAIDETRRRRARRSANLARRD